jgi:RsiW-degrading membrane proteinase PrsW (M82 family)
LRAAVDFVDSHLLRGVGFAVGGALFWLQYFDLKDRLQPEPRRLLVLAFLLGFVAAGLGLGLYRLAALVGLPDYPGPSTRSILLQFDEPIDGLIYSSAVAIGFASLESLLYAPHAGGPELLARTLTAPLTHSLFAAPWGLGLAHARLVAGSRSSRLLWQVLPLLGGMLLHGLYDFALLAYDATWLAARPVAGDHRSRASAAAPEDGFAARLSACPGYRGAPDNGLEWSFDRVD